MLVCQIFFFQVFLYLHLPVDVVFILSICMGSNKDYSDFDFEISNMFLSFQIIYMLENRVQDRIINITFSVILKHILWLLSHRINDISVPLAVIENG